VINEVGMQPLTVILVYVVLVIPPLIIAVAAAVIEDPGFRNGIIAALLAVFVAGGTATFGYHAFRGFHYEGRLRANDGTRLAARAFMTRNGCEAGMAGILQAHVDAYAAEHGHSSPNQAAPDYPARFECRWAVDF
jgi:hypothetical protein